MASPSPSAALPTLDPELRRQLFRWVWFWCGRLAVAALLLWVAGLVLLAVGFRFLGETNPFTAFFLFLPPVTWLLPGLVLWPAALLFRWRAALVLGGVVVLVVALFSDWRPGTPPTPVAPDQRPGDVLVVLTNNRGQNGGHSLRPFKNHIQPDVMLFQESSAQASAYLTDPGYAEFVHGTSIGEFTIVSRHPVTDSRLLIWQGRANVGRCSYAARFEVDWKGRKIAVYGVHMRSPREVLLAMRGGAFLYGLPLPLARWRERAAHISSFWLDQMAMAEDLLRQVAADPLPCIIAGDFNAPHLGAVHRRLAGQLEDAHSEAGFGMGFTFPGESRNPLALGGAWLRIDQIFMNSRWKAETCWTEDHRRSQHRALAAALKLVK
ncbi:MAG: endonuclease/exonuclease/phosphatase family protein [Prosthecobacter sp.]